MFITSTRANTSRADIIALCPYLDTFQTDFMFTVTFTAAEIAKYGGQPLTITTRTYNSEMSIDKGQVVVPGKASSQPAVDPSAAALASAAQQAAAQTATAQAAAQTATAQAAAQLAAAQAAAQLAARQQALDQAEEQAKEQAQRLTDAQNAAAASNLTAAETRKRVAYAAGLKAYMDETDRYMHGQETEMQHQQAFQDWTAVLESMDN